MQSPIAKLAQSKGFSVSFHTESKTYSVYPIGENPLFGFFCYTIADCFVYLNSVK